jgi:hypothetical protein
LKPDTTVYYGSREADANPTTSDPVDVTVNGTILDVGPSLRVRNHASEFNWGYGGSGPAQLALAICLDFLEGDIDRAQRVYQDFKWRVIAGLNQTGDWKMSGRYIRTMIELIEQEQGAFTTPST